MIAQKNIVITGFMGTGKTIIGRIVADLLDRPFHDTDETITRQVGQAIPDIFAEQGEPFFREREKETLILLSRSGGKVIATGGGSLLNADNVCLVELYGIIYCLEARPEILKKRLTGDISRPLLGDGDLGTHITRLLAQRDAGYRRLANHIDTSDRDPEQVAAMIMGRYLSENLRKRTA